MKSFEDIFYEWLGQEPKCELRGSKALRYEKFVVLCITLKEAGHSRESVTSKTNWVLSKVTVSRVPGYRDWRETTDTLYNAAIAKVYGDSKFKEVEVTEESVKSVKEKFSEKNESTPEVTASTVAMGEDIDRALLEAPMEVHIDKEFSKLLGFKDE